MSTSDPLPPKVVIGIHGLANKPRRDLLADWMHECENFSFDSLYNSEPYHAAKRGEPPEEERKNNHHKSYGYLRTPELSRLVKTFLGS